jgi:hypothetical protein
MIEFCFVKKNKIENRYSAVIINGHSENITLCNVISGLAKYFEFSLKKTHTENKINCPEPGVFEFYYIDNKKISVFTDVLLETARWLKLKYKKQIILKEE